METPKTVLYKKVDIADVNYYYKDSKIKLC